MTERKDESDRRVADIIHRRVGAGESGLVAGWQQMLTGLLATSHGVAAELGVAMPPSLPELLEPGA